jgi:hypothetical protein
MIEMVRTPLVGSNRPATNKRVAVNTTVMTIATAEG